MEIAALRKKVSFQKQTLEVDEYGNHKNVWKTVFSHWVTVGGESGSEVNEAGLVVEKDNFSVTTRYCNGTKAVTADQYRILLDGNAYNIESIDHMNFKGHSIKFSCRREPIHE